MSYQLCIKFNYFHTEINRFYIKLYPNRFDCDSLYQIYLNMSKYTFFIVSNDISISSTLFYVCCVLSEPEKHILHVEKHISSIQNMHSIIQNTNDRTQNMYSIIKTCIHFKNENRPLLPAWRGQLVQL